MFIIVHGSNYTGPFKTEEEAKKYIEKKAASVRREYEQHSDIRPDPLIMDRGWSEFGDGSYTLDVYDPFNDENSSYTWCIEELTNPQQ